MTKRSPNRMKKLELKREMKKNNNHNVCWDELNSMYSKMCQLLTTHAGIAQLTTDKELLSMVVDKITLINNIGILSKDLASLNTELAAIHSKHSNKSGGTDDPDELMRSISIFEEYYRFMENHDGVVMPTVYHITEQLNEAEKLLAAAKRVDSDLKDPNIISDAEIVSETLKSDVFRTETDGSVKPSNLDFDKLTQSFKNIHPELEQQQSVAVQSTEVLTLPDINSSETLKVAE